MNTVLITGANGFVGSWLIRQLLTQNVFVVATGKGESRLPFQQPNFVYEPMDFTSPQQVEKVFQQYRPQAVVHSGALSKPDDCETDKSEAYRINVEGTWHLLQQAALQHCFFVFLSTDFIFQGNKEVYTEDDCGDPVNYYGQTKLLAEAAVKRYPFDWSIVRPVLVYGKTHGGRNNILTMVAEGLRSGRTLKIFNDQTRTPTYVEDLVWGLVQVLEKQATGIFHFAGSDVLTPYQMALSVAGHLRLDASLILPVTEKDFKQPARRPARTVFDCKKAKALFGYRPTSFAEGLRKTFDS